MWFAEEYEFFNLIIFFIMRIFHFLVRYYFLNFWYLKYDLFILAEKRFDKMCNFIIISRMLSKNCQADHYYPYLWQILILIRILYWFHENKYISFDTFYRFSEGEYFLIANISYQVNTSLMFLVRCYRLFQFL